MKFEIDDILVYCGAFPDFKRITSFKIVNVTNNGYYQFHSNSNNTEWLNESYVERYYELDKTYLRKKKLKKINEKN